MPRTNTSLNPKKYVHKVLMSDETILHWARLHKIIFVWPTILAVFLFLVAIVMMFNYHVSIYLAYMSIFFIIIGLLPLAGAFIRHSTSEFAVTNKRVIFKTGFIRRKSFDLLLKNVGGISVDQDISGRIFDYGTIGVVGTAASQQFPHIADPFALKRAVEEAIQKL